jgi:hypothetical protein
MKTQAKAAEPVERGEVQTLADCEKARSFSIYDRCKAVYEGL